MRSHPLLYATRDALQDAAAAEAPGGGAWLEFGVWKGDSLNRLASRATGEVFGFDSFEGLPEDWVRGFARGAFSTDGRIPVVRPNVRLEKGWFSDTVPRFVGTHPDLKVTLVHIDCDLYESTRLVLGAIEPLLHSGAILIFDEFVGIPPDDEARAFRDCLVRRGWTYKVLGCAPNGAISVRLYAPDRTAARAELPALGDQRLTSSTS